MMHWIDTSKNQPEPGISGRYIVFWISVDDKLPEKFDMVIAFSKKRGVVPGYTASLGWVIDGYNYDDITHWMPLPGPPEVQYDRQD